jgi:4-amino-4-deoxy-L-arabinose transferase-like glycosyltransferase
VSHRRALALVAAAAALPRLLALGVERGEILAAFTEKSDDFARTFVASGTFGFVPGEPSAWTQPLYGFLLVPVYWIFGRQWLAVGLVQTGLAVATALLVYALGRRFVSPRAGLVAAIVATLNPYLVWHDVHVNREIVDGLLAAAVVLLVLLAAERGSLPSAVATGAVAGLAVLGNARLVGLPLLLAGFLLWRTRAWPAAVALAAAAVLVTVPWVVRNRVEVGCATLTTDARALWKANNEQTRGILARGGWIDDVPRIPGSPHTPEEAAALYAQTGKVEHVDECAQMRYYRGLVRDFWREHPGEKARLAVQATGMLWDPRVTRTEDRAGAGGLRDSLRTWSALYFVPLFLLGAAGLVLVRRDLAVLIGALLAYGTLAAMVFAGSTRYRVPWDFLLAIPAAAVAVRVWERTRARPVPDAVTEVSQPR